MDGIVIVAILAVAFVFFVVKGKKKKSSVSKKTTPSKPKAPTVSELKKLTKNQLVELAEKKKLKPETFYKYKVTEYNAETDWRDYPPCVQKVIQEGWTGDRNNMLFNVCVTEMKKAEGNLTVKQLKDVAWERQKTIFATHPKGPLKRNESDGTAQSVHNKGYEYFCPP